MRTQSHRRRSAICVTSVLSCFQSLSQLALHFSSLSCTCNLTSNAFTLAHVIVPQRKTCCRISNGSYKFVIDSNHNNTEVPADLPEEQTSQSSVKNFAARSKAKAKPQKRGLVELPSTIPMNKRKWIDIEPGESSLSAYEVSKKVINLLRHCQTVQREDDGAVQFWRIKNFLQSQFPQIHYWSDYRWKACLAAGGGAKRRYQYCTDVSGTIVYLRTLQGHSGRSLIDPSLQDNMIIQSGFFQHIYHIGCAF